MKHNSSLPGHFACLTAYTIFGLNIIICKDLTTSNLISPIALFSLRSIGAGILFWLISLLFPNEKIDSKDYLKILAASLLGFFLTQLTFLFGISRITPMDCSIINSITPINTMIIAAIVLKEPITLKKAGGVMISFLGVLYLIFSTVRGDNSVVETSIVGVILIILNSLCFSMYLGMFKPIISKYSVITFMKWIFLFSTILSLPLSGREIIGIEYSSLPESFLWELSFLIICATFMAYFLIPYGQKIIRPTLVSMYSYVQPIIAIIVSIYLGMDTLSWQKIVAAAMVFGGVILVNYSKSAPKRA